MCARVRVHVCVSVRVRGPKVRAKVQGVRKMRFKLQREVLQELSKLGSTKQVFPSCVCVCMCVCAATSLRPLKNRQPQQHSERHVEMSERDESEEGK